MNDLARWFSLQQAFGPQQDLATLQQLFNLDSQMGMGGYGGGYGGGMEQALPDSAGANLSPEELAVIQGIQQQMQGRGY